MESENSLALPKKTNRDRQNSWPSRRFSLRWLKKIGHVGNKSEIEMVYFAEPSFVPSAQGGNDEMHVQISLLQTRVAST